MGSGASREEDVIRENGMAQSPAVSGQRVSQMTPSTSTQGNAATHPSHNRPASQISRQLSKSSFARSDGGQSSRPILQRKNTVSKFIGNVHYSHLIHILCTARVLYTMRRF